MRQTIDERPSFFAYLSRILAFVFCLGPVVARAQQSTTLPSPSQISTAAVPSSINIPSAVGSVAPVATAAPTMLQVLTSAQRGFCARVRASPIGQLVARIRKPLSMASGGMIPAEKTPHPDEQGQPGPEGTAAQIKAVKLQAPKRQAAVKALQGIDVRYHPEAEGILIAALRADPSECVRFEAAITLSSMPVCSKPIAKALQVCVEISNSDGNPAELSERVRLQASYALANCQNCLPPSDEKDQERPEYPNENVGDGLNSTATLAFRRPFDSSSQVQRVSWLFEKETNQSDFEIASSGSSLIKPKYDSSSELMIPQQVIATSNSEIPASHQSKRPTNLWDVFRSAQQRP